MQRGFNPLKDEAVIHLWGDHGLKRETLNEKQTEALKMAVHHRCSLIQGPPG